MEQQMIEELKEHVALIPERNHIEYTKFMNKLQI